MSTICILGDWGTSSCRLYLCEGDQTLASAEIPGVKLLDSAEQAYKEAVHPWIEAHGPIPATLCGMVGSNIGWVDAGYVDCPASLKDIVQNTRKIEIAEGVVTIVPGVRTEVGLGQTPDVMRGEEAQIIGWAETHESDGYLCLPGTHTKWAQLQDGRISNFLTSVNGEMFDIITHHSVLVGKPSFPPACIGDEFRHGVEVGASPVPLMQSLMSVRSYQIFGEYNSIQAKSYLLGLLIGSDVSRSLEYAEGVDIAVIGSTAPASFYSEAIHLLGWRATVFGGQEAALTGLRLIRNYDDTES